MFKRFISVAVFVLLPVMLIGQNATHVLVLNNLGKTVSKLDLTAQSMNHEWLVVDHSTENTSPNAWVQYGENLFVVSSLKPTLRQYSLTTGDSIAECVFGDFSNPFSIARVGGKLYVTLAGADQVAVLNADNITAGPITTIPVAGWPQGLLVMGERLFVVSTGSWGASDGYVFEINTQTDSKVDSFKTTRRNPTMAIEYPIGRISVCCAGVWDADPDNILSSVEIFDAQTLVKEDSVLFHGYLDGIEKTPDDNLIVATWGAFSVYDSRNNWQPIVENLSGGKGFYFDNEGNFYTARFDTDSLYKYDATYSPAARWLVGDGPQNLLDVNMNALFVDEQNSIQPAIFDLKQNYPNPFNPSTKISFVLRNAAFVNLTIYNSLGQKITTLVNQNLIADSYDIEWNGRTQSGQSAASGIYFYRLTVGEHQQTRKVMLIR